jgi:hypothetical protein
VDQEHQQALIRQMERHTAEYAAFLFLYNPIQLYVVHKGVQFVPYASGMLNLTETSVTAQHWSVRQSAKKACEITHPHEGPYSTGEIRLPLLCGGSLSVGSMRIPRS